MKISKHILDKFLSGFMYSSFYFITYTFFSLIYLQKQPAWLQLLIPFIFYLPIIIVPRIIIWMYGYDPNNLNEKKLSMLFPSILLLIFDFLFRQEYSYSGDLFMASTAICIICLFISIDRLLGYKKFPLLTLGFKDVSNKFIIGSIIFSSLILAFKYFLPKNILSVFVLVFFIVLIILNYINSRHKSKVEDSMEHGHNILVWIFFYILISSPSILLLCFLTKQLYLILNLGEFKLDSWISAYATLLSSLIAIFILHITIANEKNKDRLKDEKDLANEIKPILYGESLNFSEGESRFLIYDNTQEVNDLSFKLENISNNPAINVRFGEQILQVSQYNDSLDKMIVLSDEELQKIGLSMYKVELSKATLIEAHKSKIYSTNLILGKNKNFNPESFNCIFIKFSIEVIYTDIYNKKNYVFLYDREYQLNETDDDKIIIFLESESTEYIAN